MSSSANPIEIRPAPRSIVVIGASAGGPRALQTVLPGLPPSFPAPVIVVQHFSRDLFDSWMHTLSQNCHLAVEPAVDGGLLIPGVITVCAPDHQFTVSRRSGDLRGRLLDDTTSTYRPSIDTTMTSVAEACGPFAVGVLLTGIGADGVEGLRSIVDTGGTSIVESEGTAAVFGMPREAIRAGVAQRVRPLHQIASELNMLLQLHERSRPETHLSDGEDEPTVRELVCRLEADEPIVVESAKSTLQSLPGGSVLSELLRLLSAREPVVRAIAVDIAKRVALDSAEAVDLLHDLCGDEDDDLRLFALDIVSAHHPPELLDVVLARCDDPNVNVAIMALKALGGYGSPRAVERLVEALRDEPARRSAAIVALGRSPSPEATQQLQALDTESFEDAYMWLHAMSMRNDATAVNAVLDRLDALLPALYPQGLASLAVLCRQGRERLPAETLRRARELPFQRLLKDNRERVRAEAIRLIGAIGDDSHLVTLVEHLESMTRSEHRLALESLAEIPGDDAAEVLLMLSEADDPAVAARALEFLRRL